MKQFRFVGFLLLCIGAGKSAAAADSLLFVPSNSPERLLWYDWHEREEIRTHDLRSVTRSRSPYLVPRIKADSTPSLSWLQFQDSDLASLFTVGSLQQFEKRAVASGFESFAGEFSLAPAPSLFFHLAGSLDESRAKDPSYTGKKWRGLAGDLSSALVGYHRKGVSLWMGRFASSWGDRQSLLLSPEVSLDGLEYSLAWKRLILRYRLSRLDGLNPDTDSVSEFSNRYLAGHRLEYALSDAVQFAIGEMVIFGGPGRTVDFGYLNPLLFFHGSQLNEDVNDNTLLFADVTVHPFSRSRFFGQLVVDDFQIDNEARGDKEPTQFAARGLFEIAEFVRGTDFQLMYSRVSNWTYNQIDPRNRYSYLGRPIANVRGNDYDELSVSARHWLSSTARLRAAVLYRRQGEGRIAAEWTEPWILATETYREPFPSGIVESLWQPTIGFDGYLTSWLFVNAEAGVHLVQNERNLESPRESRPFASVRLTIPLSFSIPIS